MYKAREREEKREIEKEKNRREVSRQKGKLSLLTKKIQTQAHKRRPAEKGNVDKFYKWVLSRTEQNVSWQSISS